MLPSPSTSSIGMEDLTWADVELLSFHPTVEEMRYTVQPTNDAELSKLSVTLENWLETCSPEENAIFMEEMKKMEEMNSQDLAAPYNTTGHQSLHDASIFTHPPDIKPCQLIVARNSEKFLQSGQTFVKPDPELHVDQQHNFISSFSGNLVLQPVSPTHVVEEMLTSDGYAQSNLPCQEELAFQRLHGPSVEHGLNSGNNNPQGLNGNSGWRTGPNLYGPGPSLYGQSQSYETEFGDVDVGEDRLLYEDDDRQSSSPGSVRAGGRRYSSAEKKERRKEQNRRAATKCRNRKKAEFETFKEECERVKLENTKLRHQREKLRQIVNQLNTKLLCHKRTCSFSNEL